MCVTCDNTVQHEVTLLNKITQCSLELWMLKTDEKRNKYMNQKLLFLLHFEIMKQKSHTINKHP